MYLFSGKLLPIIVLVILPAVLLMLMQFNVPFAFQLAIVTIMLGIYPLYLYRYPLEKYFKKTAFENIVVEFEYIKKILYISLPIPIIVAVLFFTKILPHDVIFGRLVDALLNFLLYLILAGIFRMVLLIVRKEFWLYFAKGCFKIISKKGDDFEKLKYMIMGVNSYDKYLRRQINFHIKHIKKIHSKFICAPIEERRQIIKALSCAFESDRFEPLMYLSTFLKVADSGEFLEEESLWQKLKTVGAFLVTAIPILISIIK